MAESLEQGLRRLMVSFGHLVERIIGGAKKARVQVETRGGLRPVLSLESQLSQEMIRKLVQLSEQRTLSTNLPGLANRRSLELCDGKAEFLRQLLQLGSEVAVGLDFGPVSGNEQGDISRGFLVKASLENLPFSKMTFDYVVARFATSFQRDIVEALKEIGRVLTPGGQGVIIDYHPFGLYARRGTHRVRGLGSPLHGFEEYYNICRKGGMRVIDLKEVFLDEEFRKHFSEKEIAAYRNLKGTPLIVSLFVYKPRKNS